MMFEVIQASQETPFLERCEHAQPALGSHRGAGGEKAFMIRIDA